MPITQIRNPETPEVLAPDFPICWVPIAQFVLTGDDVISFTGIPPTYRNLALAFQARSDVNAEGDNMHMTFNGDSAGANANYDWMRKWALASNAFTADGAIGDDYIRIAHIDGNTATAFSFPVSIIYIQGYALTDRLKWAWCSNSGAFGNISGLADMLILDARGRWKKDKALAINRIDLEPDGGTDFKAGSIFQLYGIL